MISVLLVLSLVLSTAMWVGGMFFWVAASGAASVQGLVIGVAGISMAIVSLMCLRRRNQ